MKITSDLEIKFGKKNRRPLTIKANREIKGIESFAGKGTDQPLVKAGAIAKQYGGNPQDWTHKTGTTVVTTKDDTEMKAEVHWFENDDIGQCGWKLESFIEE